MYSTRHEVFLYKRNRFNGSASTAPPLYLLLRRLSANGPPLVTELEQGISDAIKGPCKSRYPEYGHYSAIMNPNNNRSPVPDPEPSLGSSYRASQSPVEHCNSPEPGKDFAFMSLESLRSSFSDLGVDTDKLPKPVMPDKVGISEWKKKRDMDDGCDFEKDIDTDSLKSVEIVIEDLKESKA